jgi:hypothetical protein
MAAEAEALITEALKPKLDRLHCGICLELATRPLRPPCEHVFCASCLDAWRGVCAEQKAKVRCPGCRGPCDSAECKPVPLDSIIGLALFGSTHVGCVLKDNGCQWKGEYATLMTHLKTQCVVLNNTSSSPRAPASSPAPPPSPPRRWQPSIMDVRTLRQRVPPARPVRPPAASHGNGPRDRSQSPAPPRRGRSRSPSCGCGRRACGDDSYPGSPFMCAARRNGTRESHSRSRSRSRSRSPSPNTPAPASSGTGSSASAPIVIN